MRPLVPGADEGSVSIVVGRESIGSRGASGDIPARIDALQTETGQAKGILMERHKVTGDQAFLVLSMTSQRTDTTLKDVADHLLTSGELPAQENAS
ncbi:ANTAR domain-containing protein [Arthrobacter sp. TMS2-4]